MAAPFQSSGCGICESFPAHPTRPVLSTRPVDKPLLPRAKPKAFRLRRLRARVRRYNAEESSGPRRSLSEAQSFTETRMSHAPCRTGAESCAPSRPPNLVPVPVERPSTRRRSGFAELRAWDNAYGSRGLLSAAVMRSTPRARLTLRPCAASSWRGPTDRLDLHGGAPQHGQTDGSANFGVATTAHWVDCGRGRTASPPIQSSFPASTLCASPEFLVDGRRHDHRLSHSCAFSATLALPR